MSLTVSLRALTGPFAAIFFGAVICLADSGFHVDAVEVLGETLRSSDIKVGGGFVRGTGEIGEGKWNVVFGVERISLNYRPNPRVDAVRRETVLREHTRSAVLGYGKNFSESFEWTVTGMCRDGFGNYTAVWIDEYFRQQFGTFSEYRSASPGSVAIEGALRWEMVRANVFVETALGFGRETIAPGYDRGFEADGFSLSRENDRLDSIALAVSLEAFLSKRFRTRHSIFAVGISPRSPRYAYTGELIWGVSRDLTMRGSIHATSDGTQYQALVMQSSARWEFRSGWWIGLSGRYYTDNGRMEEDSLTLFSAASPALTSYESLFHLNWEGRRTLVGLSFGPYRTRHSSRETANSPFLHLFSNRNWFRTRAVLNRRF